MVTVNVSLHENAPKQPFLIHKNFICHYSPYFDAAFNGNFVEGETQTLDLEDTHPEVFGVFVQWLYTQQIIEPEESQRTLSQPRRLMSLWILADKVLVPRLQNETFRRIDCFRKGATPELWTSVREIYHDIYNNTQIESPLREYFVIFHVGCIVKDEEQLYPHEMLVDLLNHEKKPTPSGTRRGRARLNIRPPSDIAKYFVPEEVPKRH
jgi:hypothetical protein